MKVIVGKMPGGRATEVEIPEGGTVLDAIKAAGYEQDLNNGFEARMNNSQTELSNTVSANSIITLTSKITGNGISAISVVPVGTGASHERFVVLTPVIVHDFANIPDVKSMLLKLKQTVLNVPIKCIVADAENLKISKPMEIVIFGETVICADTSTAIDAGNYVVFCNESISDKIYQMDPLSAITYIEEYIPEENRNPKSLAASQIPEDAKEIEVTEDKCCEEDYSCDKDCASCDEKDDCSAVSEAKKYKLYKGTKEDNPYCNPSECCEDCEEETCGQCHIEGTETKYCNDDTEGCCCDEECLPEEYITVSELVAMCKRLGIDLSINVPGSASIFRN